MKLKRTSRNGYIAFGINAIANIRDQDITATVDGDSTGTTAIGGADAVVQDGEVNTARGGEGAAVGLVAELVNGYVAHSHHSGMDWANFQHRFDRAYPEFTATLAQPFPSLTTGEIRLLILAKMKMSLKESAILLGISPNSVKQGRYRLRKKLSGLSQALEELLD